MYGVYTILFILRCSYAHDAESWRLYVVSFCTWWVFIEIPTLTYTCLIFCIQLCYLPTIVWWVFWLTYLVGRCQHGSYELWIQTIYYQSILVHWFNVYKSRCLGKCFRLVWGLCIYIWGATMCLGKFYSLIPYSVLVVPYWVSKNIFASFSYIQ